MMVPVEWTTIYSWCAVLGVTVVGLSFLMGHTGIGDHGGGHDVGGHDVGGTGHDVSGGHDPPLPLFSPAVLSIFVGMFGIGGLLLHKVLGLQAVPVHVLGASGISLASGFGMAVTMRQIFKATEKNSLASFRDVVGREVEVLTAIRGRNLGEIAYTSGGSRQTLLARSATDADLSQGSRVHVLDVRDGIALVGERGTQPLVETRVAEGAGPETKR
jgi:hypothetical protein